MTYYLLDTNAVSHFLRGHPQVCARLRRLALSEFAVSCLTEAELLYGLGKNPQATRLAQTVHEFLRTVNVLPWDRTAARHYADLRNQIERQGWNLTDIDALIAAHAVAVDAVLVSNDQAFKQVAGLRLEDWTQ